MSQITLSSTQKNLPTPVSFSPKTKELIEKFNAIKQVAHAWEITGVSRMNDIDVKIQGTFYVNFREKFQKSLEDFHETYNELISPKEIEHLRSLLEEREVNNFEQDASILFEDLQNEKPISISSGFIGHTVIVAFDKDYLLISNKGSETRRPIEIYKINPEKITKSSIQEIINLRKEPKKKYTNWLANIHRSFDATKTPLALWIEQAYPLSSYQQVGNCVWESLQTCVYGILMLNRLRLGFESHSSQTKTETETCKKAFLSWKEFLQIQSLEKYFCAFRTSLTSLPILTGQPKEEPGDSSFTFEGIDRGLLRNIFREYWSKTPTSIEFRQKMDKLELQYFKTLSGLSLTQAKAEKLYYNQTRIIPHIAKDLAYIWTPSILSTAFLAASYALFPSSLWDKATEMGLSSYLEEYGATTGFAILAPAYLFSATHTVQLTRRHFAI